MATRTGRLVLDRKTGKMVEEVKEDQMAVALHDPACAKPEDHAFRFVLRSDFTLAKINALFSCNAALLKDPFGNVLWPKDWMTQVLPPKGADKWFYIIHERVEPPPRDDLLDPLYAGGAAVVLSGVPVQCEAVDLTTWLLFGVAQDFAPLQRVKSDMELTRRKKLMLKHKLDALPTMDVEGSSAQQVETRQRLADAIEGHAARYDEELTSLAKRKARIEKLLYTEPLTLSIVESTGVQAAKQPTGGSGKAEQPPETRTWAVQFSSTRGQELATIAMAKCDWNYVCLAQTRPTPTAFLESEQVEAGDGALSASDLDKEVNMRTVRLERLRHGRGELLSAIEGPSDGADSTAAAHVDPSAEDFHFSSLGALYAGEFRLGEQHGRGRHVTNAGVYEGEFERGTRSGKGKMVYGKGTTCWGTFAPASPRRYAHGKKAKGKACTPSLLNTRAFREGVEHGERMRLQFPDGATYDGEMVDGRVCGLGRYVSSTGVVESGSFVDGVLSGEHCRREFPDGSVEAGAFVDGQLHGRGRVRDKHGDEFSGFFEHGVRQGRGQSLLLRGSCKHVGFWRENAMDGRGDLLYTDKPENENGNGNVTGTGTDTDAGEAEAESGFLGGGRWRYWYEGGFLHGETRARHRHVALWTTTEASPLGAPFTTNASSGAAMPFLSAEMPAALAKADRRGRANARRRVGRERAFLAQRERDNLALYYALLDGFYEDWTARTRFQKHVGEMESEAERRQAEQEREAQQQFERERERRRKEQYGLAPPKRDLLRFEDFLERITLTEHTRLQRAMAAEGMPDKR